VPDLNKKTTCGVCEGRKICTSCGGSGIVERMDVRMACAVCSGGGRCLHCGGSGEMEDGDGRAPPIKAG
jgi:hypothetical protein